MRLISKTLCCAGQVLPVLAWSGLLDVREREGGGWRLHRPRGLHHTQVLYPICKCFYLCWMPKVPSCAAVQPETCTLWTFLILSAFVNVASLLFPASQRCRQDPQTCHPAPLHQLAWLWSSLLAHWHVEVPQKGQGHQPLFLWACRGPLQVLNGLVVSRHVLPVRVHLSETFALSCVPTRTDVSLFGCCRLRTRSRQLSVSRPLFGCVVCPRSAGVGRTGTFIVIDAMIEMMHAEQKVDVFGFVSKIRSQRSQLVQTDVSAPRPPTGLTCSWKSSWYLCSDLRCSTHSSTRLCLNTTSTETPSWMCRLSKDTCTNCTTPSWTAIGSAWKKSLRCLEKIAFSHLHFLNL